MPNRKIFQKPWISRSEIALDDQIAVKPRGLGTTGAFTVVPKVDPVAEPTIDLSRLKNPTPVVALVVSGSVEVHFAVVLGVVA